MPIVNDDEEQTRNKENSVGGGSSWVGGGQSAGSPTIGQGSQQGQQSQAQQQDPNGFVNIQQYLGGPGADKSGANIAGNVSNLADVYGNGATTQADRFTNTSASNIANGTPSYDPNVAASWMDQTSVSDAGKLAASSGQTPPAVSFGAISPPSDYTGKTSYADMPGYQDAKKAADTSTEWMKNSASQPGLQAQLQGMNKGSGYTQGDSVLDTALAASGGQGILAGSQKKWGGVQDYLSGAEKGVQNKIGAAQNQAADVSRQWDTAQKAAAANQTATNAEYGKIGQTYLDNVNKGKTFQENAKGFHVGSTNPTTAITYPKPEQPSKNHTGEIGYQMDPKNWFDPTRPDLGTADPYTNIPIISAGKAANWVDDVSKRNKINKIFS